MNKNNDMLDIFKRSGFSMSTHQIEQFIRYYHLIKKYNTLLDLTRLNLYKDIVIKHFVDSIYVTKLIELPSSIIDIGTGAGFPGIPLKILDHGLHLILSEPRKKRAGFLETVVRELDLTGVEIYPHLVTEKSFFAVEGVITRALEPINDTLTRVSHFLARGGKVIFMKGPAAEAEITAVSQENREIYSLESNRRYTLPSTNYIRRIIVYKKESDAVRKTYSILKNNTATAGSAITSGENKQYKELKRLCSGEGIRKTGKALVSGKKIITEILRKGRTVTTCIIYDGYAEYDDYMNAAIEKFRRSGSLIILKKSLFNQIDLFNTCGPLLVVRLPDILEWDLSLDTGCTLAIPFQDPANVGSAIRSAVGFKVKKIIILKEAAHPYHPKSIRSSAGTVFCANIMKGPSLYDLAGVLPDKAEVIALDKGGTPLTSFRFPERFLLLPGMEGPGLPDAFKQRSISISHSSEIESLNAPVALSIALHEWSRRYSPSN